MAALGDKTFILGGSGMSCNPTLGVPGSLGRIIQGPYPNSGAVIMPNAPWEPFRFIPPTPLPPPLPPMVFPPVQPMLSLAPGPWSNAVTPCNVGMPMPPPGMFPGY